jgi:hemolysin III
MTQRNQSIGEEAANAVSHGLGFLLAAAALPVLMGLAQRQGSTAQLLGAGIFVGTMMLLYLASAVFHALPEGRAKALFNRVDHAAIFIFIAGSYTPFVIGPTQGSWEWTLFGLVWGLAALGVLLKALGRLTHRLKSTALYVALGWVAVAAAGPLLQRLPSHSLMLLAAGAAAYTVGAVFFLLDHRLRYGHFVWHLFVLTGSTCHFFAALGPVGS